MNLRFLTRSAVLLLAIAIFVGFGLQISIREVTSRGYFDPDRAWTEPWRWLTAAFLHGSPMHLVFNIWALVLFGMQLESTVGPRRLLALFIAGALAGDVGYLATGGTGPALGASGAIYALMGTLVVLQPQMKIIMFPLYFPMPLIVAVFLWAALDIFRVFTPSTIAGGAHLGGLALGLWAGFYLKRPRRSRPAAEERAIIAPASRIRIQAPPQAGSRFACERCGYVATHYSEVEASRCPGCGEPPRWQPLQP